MSPSEGAAETLVTAYLNGRTLPKMLHRTAVWVAQARLAGGQLPVLSEFLRRDIDTEATTPPGDDKKLHGTRRDD